ncbi:hypothetical protein AXF42_Ash020833 [Apostasia shenzhenica]|uniref:Uncharacterized protein n=1 Tax=Apostasia shenzhenica TaxID=1088818 RepID=A0A2I0A3D5_9ASPA|nr:hypothetical protein AXF42_Ash020833 [Apostasia shenzhenica]
MRTATEPPFSASSACHLRQVREREFPFSPSRFRTPVPLRSAVPPRAAVALQLPQAPAAGGGEEEEEEKRGGGEKEKGKVES